MNAEDNSKFQGPEHSISNKPPFHKGISEEYQATNIQEVQARKKKNELQLLGKTVLEKPVNMSMHTSDVKILP